VAVSEQAVDQDVTSGTAGASAAGAPAGSGLPARSGGPTRRARPSLGSRLTKLADALWRPALVLVAIFAIWWFVADREYIANYLIPTPGQVWDKLTSEWDFLLENSMITLYETVLGFVLATVIGIASAVLITYSPTMERSLYPIVLFAQVIPKIAIAPLLGVLLGTGMAPKIVLAVLIAFFPVVVSGVSGLRSTDPELIDLSATMGAGPWKTFRKIRFPNALPHLMSGMKVAVTLAVTGAVVGEFVGASEGLGYVLLLASGNLDSALLFADLILMSVIGIVLFVIVEIAEAFLIPWHASRRSGVPLTTS
jgi:NitT/TauT family transport system permease protein